MAYYEYPKKDYNFPPDYDEKELVDFQMIEDRHDHTVIVSDPDVPYQRWELRMPCLRYIFKQVIRTSFTNPASYGDSERTPYRSISTGQAAGEELAIVTLAEAIGTVDNWDNAARIYEWEVTKHELGMEEPGLYYVDFTLTAFSDYIWETDKFMKIKLPRAGDVGLSDSPEAS